VLMRGYFCCSGELDKLGHENSELRNKLRDTERLSQQAHDLLNRTANELTQVTYHL
jgi:hypothetical protein